MYNGEYMAFYLMVGIPYALINLWTAWWAWRCLAGTGPVRVCVCLAIVFLALLFPLFYRRPGDSFFNLALTRIGAAWIGVFFYIFLMALLADAALLAARFWNHPLSPAVRQAVCGGVLALCVCIGTVSWFIAAMPMVREYDLEVPAGESVLKRWGGKPLTIAAVADMHLGKIITAARLEKVLELVAPHKPDLLLFLGDLLDDHFLLDREAMKRAVSGVAAPLGVYGIAGNHEYLSGPIAVSIDIHEQSGIKVLRDQWTELEGGVILLGRDDYSMARFPGGRRKELPDIMADMPAGLQGRPLIVMDHEPYHLEQAEQAGAALQLSGHTHNGQFWPFNLVVARVFENPLGYLRRGGTHYVTSAGAGTWGPPLRNTARPDVLLIRLRFVAEAR